MKHRILTVAILLNVVLIVVASLLLHRLWKSEESLRHAEVKAEYESLVRRLCIPAESLYHNAETFRQICELRKSDFPKEFTPYQALMRPHVASIYKSETPGDIWNGSFQIYWLNEADHGLAELISHIENGRALGAYIQDNADKNDSPIVPLVERMLKSHHRRHRIGAAHVLLVLGRRDQKIKDVLKTFLDEEKRPVRTDDGMQMRYSSERDRAAKLDSQYQLGVYRQPVNKPDAGGGT